MFDPKRFTQEAEFYTEDFLDSVSRLRGTAAIDRAFAKHVVALPEAERQEVVELLDKAFFSRHIVADLRAEIRDRGLEAVKHAVKDDIANYKNKAQAIREAQLSARVVYNIRKLKGNFASPLIKAYADAAANARGIDCVTAPLNAVIDAIVEKDNQPNRCADRFLREPRMNANSRHFFSNIISKNCL